MSPTIYSADEYPQNSLAWLELHKGIPTASSFNLVMAKTGPRGGTSGREYVGRTNYMRLLAGEIITGELRDSGWAGNRHTDRGHEREDEALATYSFLKDAEPQRVGFVRNGNCGASPDALLGDDGGLEAKDCLAHIQIARLQDGTLPSEYRWQVIGSLLVTERDWWDFISNSRGLPPLIVRTKRKDVKQELIDLRNGIDRFAAETAQLVELVRAMW